MHSGRLLGVALLPIVVACAAPRPETKPAGAWFELAGEFNVPALTLFAPLRSARFGGVSGLAFDPRPGPTGGDLLGISDDRDAARLFIFRVEGVGPSFTVHLRAYLPLPHGLPDLSRRISARVLKTRSNSVFSTGR